MENSNNHVSLRGILMAKPEISHRGRYEQYYIFPLGIERLSGAVDVINIIARQSLIESMEITEDAFIAVSGELRSFNNKSGTGNRLVITVFAREMSFSSGEFENVVNLSGTLCKPPNHRETPMGREICDIMLAVNRRYGRSDYLPCIAWGQIAGTVAELGIGDQLTLTGRIQSRNYIKVDGDVSTEKTAFEVSVVDISL